MTNHEVLKELEKAIELEGKAQGTLERYTSNIKKLMEYYSGKKICSLTENELREYAFYLHRKRYRTGTYNNHIASIRYVYKKVIFKNINMNKIPYKRNQKKEVMIPTAEEIKKMVKNCEERKMQIAILLSATSGLRLGEIVKIKASDINANRGQIRIEGKGKRERWTIIDEKVIEMLRKYWKEEREKIEGNEYIFAKRNYIGHLRSDYISREMRKVIEKAKLRNYTIHSLRHYFATSVYNQTKDIEYVSKLLGHENIITTEKYIHVKEIEYKIKSPVLEILDKPRGTV